MFSDMWHADIPCAVINKVRIQPGQNAVKPSRERFRSIGDTIPLAHDKPHSVP